ncbi:MAG: hypothetical protein EA379_02450 [Phycisphaerales bacterium]|jgi:hypothetical protein|nr:MAG: hypothetical protein EA379_02450 [Phycisphaerales bacterium]
MRRTEMLARIVIAVCAVGVLVQAVALWRATGGAGFTRYFDEARAAREAAQEPSLSDLFEGTGLDDAHGKMEAVENRFALGLLPSGPDKHAVSVLTLALPSLLALGVAASPWGRRRAR